ncbi:hypothetical protein LTR08_003156 [Meristemomyces frigidus]|nr:hypothetical protein LTR08_003156 [Meristemomyces frigidus]
MNTRTPIQPPNRPTVLSASFSHSHNRFITGTSTGLRCFRTDNCLTTYHPTLPTEGAIAIAEALDDRYLAFVAAGRTPAGKRSLVIFWDALLGTELNRFDFHEPVLGLRLNSTSMLVALHDRTILFDHQHIAPPTPPPDVPDNPQDTPDPPLRAPNSPKALYPTAPNPHALAALHPTLLALPALTPGQIQLIPLLPTTSTSKRVLRAHNSALRRLALSPNGTLLATASEQGTLLRVFHTTTTDQVAEFRRGVDPAVILSLAFSPANRWLACTSDKGTLHLFDLRPSATSARGKPPPRPQQQQQQQQPHQHQPPHPRKNPAPRPTYPASKPSTLSSPPPPPSPSHQGSLQEYYSLRPVPSSATPPTQNPASTALTALKASPWAPKILTDARSAASCAFHMGEDGPEWRGGGGAAGGGGR